MNEKLATRFGFDADYKKRTLYAVVCVLAFQMALLFVSYIHPVKKIIWSSGPTTPEEMAHNISVVWSGLTDPFVWLVMLGQPILFAVYALVTIYFLFHVVIGIMDKLTPTPPQS